jgi:hypothetical protein
MQMRKVKLRDVVVFLAGAEFFHTLSHVMLAYSVTFPWQTKHMLVTQAVNNKAILINAAVTVALLWWASRIRK